MIGEVWHKMGLNRWVRIEILEGRSKSRFHLSSGFFGSFDMVEAHIWGVGMMLILIMLFF